jgi:hypothetical protein
MANNGPKPEARQNNGAVIDTPPPHPAAKSCVRTTLFTQSLRVMTMDRTRDISILRRRIEMAVFPTNFKAGDR